MDHDDNQSQNTYIPTITVLASPRELTNGSENAGSSDHQYLGQGGPAEGKDPQVPGSDLIGADKLEDQHIVGRCRFANGPWRRDEAVGGFGGGGHRREPWCRCCSPHDARTDASPTRSAFRLSDTVFRLECQRGSRISQNERARDGARKRNRTTKNAWNSTRMISLIWLKVARGSCPRCHPSHLRHQPLPAHTRGSGQAWWNIAVFPNFELLFVCNVLVGLVLPGVPDRGGYHPNFSSADVTPPTRVAFRYPAQNEPVENSGREMDPV